MTLMGRVLINGLFHSYRLLTTPKIDVKRHPLQLLRYCIVNSSDTPCTWPAIQVLQRVVLSRNDFVSLEMSNIQSNLSPNSDTCNVLSDCVSHTHL